MVDVVSRWNADNITIPIITSLPGCNWGTQSSHSDQNPVWIGIKATLNANFFLICFANYMFVGVSVDLRLLAVMNNPVSFISSDSCVATCDSTGNSSLFLIRTTCEEEVGTELARKERAAVAANHYKEPQSLVLCQKDGTNSLEGCSCPLEINLFFLSIGSQFFSETTTWSQQ